MRSSTVNDFQGAFGRRSVQESQKVGLYRKSLHPQLAKKQLAKLDKNTAKLIASWLKKNLEGCDNPRIHGKELKGQYAGIWRYRVGDYRICAQIRESESIILVVAIRHRSKAYGV